MEIKQTTEYTIKMTRDEFRALYEFLGATSQSQRENALEGYGDSTSKANLLDRMWNELNEAV